MAPILEFVHKGSVTSPEGYLAGATYAGLKTLEEDTLDLGILISEAQASLAATFTTNRVESPSVTLSRQRAAMHTARGVVANSGCANCCVGSQGLLDAKEMTSLAAKHTNIAPEEMLVCSTGVIGVELPMALIRQNLGNVTLTPDGGHMFARAIMTTDSRPKDMAVSLEIDGARVTVGGAAKGVGMIHPNMATMLAFITTDAAIEPEHLNTALKNAVNLSFNMIDVDGDQSTNDTVLLFANGASGCPTIKNGTAAADAFQEALNYVCIGLAKELARDGEGAQRLLEVVVDGANSKADAKIAAREIASSSLVKAMVHGLDPNWGRIMMALGKSGIPLDESKVDIFVKDIQIVHNGMAIPYFKDAVVSAMNVPEVGFRVSLNVGDGVATAWGCDLTEEYVTFNSAYST